MAKKTAKTTARKTASRKKTAKKPSRDREPDGRFRPGNQEARKGGRPKNEVVEARRLFFEGHLADAQEALTACLAPTSPPKNRLRAAELVFAYVYGRPLQQVSVESNAPEILESIDAARAQFLQEAAAAARSSE